MADCYTEENCRLRSRCGKILTTKRNLETSWLAGRRFFWMAPAMESVVKTW